MPRKKRTTKQEAGIIVLENFNEGTIFQRFVNVEERYLNRLIFSPTYLYKLVSGGSITDMNDATYPLLTPFLVNTISLTASTGKITSFAIPSVANDNRVLYVSTNSGKVRALSLTGVARDLGQPVTLTNNYNTTLAIYTDKLFFVNPASTSIYHIPETTTGTTWTSVGGFNSPYLAIPFSIYLYIADKNSSTASNRQLIKVLNTSYAVAGSFDLGTNWDIIDIANNNNKFLVVIARPVGSFARETAFLWDGSYQNVAFHRINLPGNYVGSVNYMGSFLMFLQVGASLSIYELQGFSLKFIGSFPSINISTKLLPSNRFSTFGNYIVFPALLKDVAIKSIIVYNILENEALCVNAETTNEVIGVVLNKDLNNNTRCFFVDDTDDTLKQVMILPNGFLDDITEGFKQKTDDLIYQSNKILFVKPVFIEKLEVFYGNSPTNSSDKIKIEVKGRNVRTSEEMTSTSIIDINSSNNYVFFDNIGVVGDEIQVSIKLTNTTNFRSNIKRILIHYSNL